MMIKITSIAKNAIILSSSITILLNLWGNPSRAGDPFRSRDQRQIGDRTEAAFIAFFRQGDYRKGKAHIDQAITSEANEPLLWTLYVAHAYLENDREGMKKYGTKILETARQLVSKDALRGNLYEGVAYFIEAAYLYETQGALNSIGKVQQALREFDAAEKSDPDDPEYNLFKGYLNLLLAANLPFSNPEQSIDNFQEYAAPDYLVDRGIALAYRDLKQFDSALKYADKALENAPENPELEYLKGQILRLLGTKTDDLATLQQAATHFTKALEKADQLPESITRSIRSEYDKTQALVVELKKNP
jgi:tetratricopeptide (TPR) repeat protein